MVRIPLRFILSAIAASWLVQADTNDGRVSNLLSAYVNALGGKEAIDRIQTRQLEAKLGRTEKWTFYWQAPDHVLQVERKGKRAAEGNSGWIETKKNKIIKLARGDADAMQTIANPIRFVHLRDMYRELHVAPDVSIDGQPMTVIVAPNNNGATKFFFSKGDHLLCRVEEFGVNSVYYKHITDFSKYKAIDGLKLPTNLHRSTDEPGGGAGDWKLDKIKQNIPIESNIFQKPTVGAPITGGSKR